MGWQRRVDDDVGAQLTGAELVRHEPVPTSDPDPAGEAGCADAHGLLQGLPARTSAR